MKRAAKALGLVIGIVLVLGLSAHVVVNYLVPYVARMHAGG